MTYAEAYKNQQKKKMEVSKTSELSTRQRFVNTGTPMEHVNLENNVLLLMARKI